MTIYCILYRGAKWSGLTCFRKYAENCDVRKCVGHLKGSVIFLFMAMVCHTEIVQDTFTAILTIKQHKTEKFRNEDNRALGAFGIKYRFQMLG